MVWWVGIPISIPFHIRVCAANTLIQRTWIHRDAVVAVLENKVAIPVILGKN